MFVSELVNQKPCDKEVNMLRLRAEVMGVGVLAGNLCPICGGDKSGGARICRSCYRTHGGNNATVVVDDVLAAFDRVVEGHQLSQKFGGVQRGTDLGPILAQVRVGKGAEFIPAHDGFPNSYLKFGTSVRGGYVNNFAFGVGENDIGKVVVGLVELRVKETPKGPTFYIRIEVVNGVKSDVKLAIRNLEDGNGMVKSFPSRRVENLEHGPRRLNFSAGFVSA